MVNHIGGGQLRQVICVHFYTHAAVFFSCMYICNYLITQPAPVRYWCYDAIHLCWNSPPPLPHCSLLTTCVVAKLGRAELAKENRAQGGSTAQHINTFVSVSSDFPSDVRSCTNKIVLNLIVSTTEIKFYLGNGKWKVICRVNKDPCNNLEADKRFAGSQQVVRCVH